MLITAERREAIVQRVVDLDTRIEALRLEAQASQGDRAHRLRGLLRKLAVILWADNAAGGCFHIGQ